MVNTIVEFRLIVNLAKSVYAPLGRKSMNVLPKDGSIINIDGNPFVVFKVSYAVETTHATDEFIYVEVFKAGCYKLKVGGVSH